MDNTHNPERRLINAIQKGLPRYASATTIQPPLFQTTRCHLHRQCHCRHTSLRNTIVGANLRVRPGLTAHTQYHLFLGESACTPYL
ncbi:MAG TPA: hypothetical protein EYP59_06310 [Thiotrichaceae bacterium]|nr:hypothetical protein [Thiotrichaceae bacterium]